MVTVPSYQHGAIRSDAAKLALTLPAHKHEVVAATLAGPLATEASLAAWECTRTNQGQCEGCTAHATAAAVFAAFAAIGMPGILLSMRFLYAASGLLEGSVPQDNGRQIADVMTVLQGGFPAFEGMSPDDRFSDIWTANDTSAKPPNVNLIPSGLEQKLATTHSVGQHTVDLTQSNASDIAAAVLSASKPAPLVIGTFVGPRFEHATPDDVVGPETDDGSGAGGGHAIEISGYRTVNGARQWRVTNSWGPSWCDNGRVWVTDAFLLSAWECWAMTLTSIAARS